MRQGIRIAVVLSAVLFALTGCRLVKDVSLEEDTGGGQMEVMQVRKDSDHYDVEQFTKQFLGLSFKDAMKYNADNAVEGGYSFQKDGLQLIFSPISPDQEYHVTIAAFYDHNENVGPAYETMIYQEETSNLFVDYCRAGLRDYFPEENLDNCSREDAISFCRPYAEALGYGDAEVTVFAMREQELQDIATGRRGGSTIFYGAPDPDCELVYRERELPQREPVPWEKKDEAFFLIYCPKIGEYRIDWGYQECRMIYVPARKEVVYAEASLPMSLESVGNEDIISSEAAVSKVMQVNGVSDKKDIEIKSTEMVYSSDFEQFQEDGWFHPYWRVDFKTNKNPQDKMTKTMLVNAVTGQFSRFEDV